MAIEDIKKGLFKGEEENVPEEKEKEPIFFHEDNFRTPEGGQSWIREIKKEPAQALASLTPKISFFKKLYQWIIYHQKRIYAILGAIIGLTLVAFLLIFFIGSASFAKKDVILTISGEPHGDSGSEINYTVSYQNKTKLTLHDARILITFPERSQMQNNASEYGPYTQAQQIGDIPTGAKGSVNFKARIFGVKDERLSVAAKIRYRPEGISSEFENESETDFIIDSVPLAVTFNLPQRAVVGQPYVLSIDYTNQSDAEFKDIWFRMLYPVGFNFQIASPTPSEGNSNWKISSIAPYSNASIMVSGILSGVSGETKSFEVKVGPKDEFSQLVQYVDAQSSAPISQSLLVVSQTVNGGLPKNVSAGDLLKWNIHYKNTTTIGLNNVQITTQFRGNILDFSRLKITKGYFDAASSKIIWNASDIPALGLVGPQQAGDLQFSIEVKDPPPIFSISDKDLLENISVSIISATLPNIGELGNIPVGNVDSMDLKLNSKIVFESKGLYYSGPFTNTGPIPPKVGQVTTFTILWQITNWSSDISNVKVRANLPSTAQWTGEISPAGAPISYEASSDQITWIPGLIKAGAGATSSIEEVAFRVKIIPSVNQLKQKVELLGQALLGAQDNFTNRTFQTLKEAITTSLKEDPRFPTGGAYVTQ